MCKGFGEVFCFKTQYRLEIEFWELWVSTPGRAIVGSKAFCRAGRCIMTRRSRNYTSGTWNIKNINFPNVFSSAAWLLWSLLPRTHIIRETYAGGLRTKSLINQMQQQQWRVMTEEAYTILSDIPPLYIRQRWQTLTQAWGWICVSVCAWASFKAVARLSVLSVKSSIVLFKTKELLCVQTQQAVASHSGEICSNRSNSPRINAIPHTLSLSHTHKLSACLCVCLPAHSHTQTNKQGAKFSRDGKPKLRSAKADTLDSHCQMGEELSREEREPVTQGSKTFSSVVDLADLARTLTVYSDSRDSSVGRYHTDTHYTWSWIPNPRPLHILIPALTKFQKTGKTHQTLQAAEYSPCCLSNAMYLTPQTSAPSYWSWLEYALLIELGKLFNPILTTSRQCLVQRQCQGYKHRYIPVWEAPRKKKKQADVVLRCNRLNSHSATRLIIISQNWTHNVNNVICERYNQHFERCYLCFF